jgi:beta-N-acetylhexosaminidase
MPTMKGRMRIGALVAVAALAAGVAGCTDPSPEPSPPSASPTPSAAASGSPTPIPSPTLSEWEAALAEAHALPEDEAIGRVIVAAVSDDDPKAAADLVRSRHLGGIILMPGSLETADGVRALTSAVQQVGSERGLPVLVGVDEEGGTVSRLRGILPAMPAFMAAGALDDAEATRAAWAQRGASMRAMGITVDFAPVADITSGLADPTIRTRAASSNPERASRSVLAVTDGLEGVGVVPVIKHFPGHGSARQDSHTSLAVVSKPLSKLAASDLVPFRDAIDAGAPAVMTGHLVVKNWGRLPASVNPLAYDYLREDLGFDGVVFTDALNMEGVTDVYPPGRVEYKALAAGADAVLFPADVDVAIAGIRKALDTGALSRSRLDEAVARMGLLAKASVAEPAGPAADAPSVVDYSTSAAVVAARYCSGVIDGTVGITGGGQSQRKRLASELRELGVKTVAPAKADTTIALLPYDRSAAKADVVVALGGPWGFARSKAQAYVAVWGSGAPQMAALARVLVDPSEAHGTWPVPMSLPYEACGRAAA